METLSTCLVDGSRANLAPMAIKKFVKKEDDELLRA